MHPTGKSNQDLTTQVRPGCFSCPVLYLTSTVPTFILQGLHAPNGLRDLRRGSSLAQPKKDVDPSVVPFVRRMHVAWASVCRPAAFFRLKATLHLRLPNNYLNSFSTSIFHFTTLVFVLVFRSPLPSPPLPSSLLWVLDHHFHRAALPVLISAVHLVLRVLGTVHLPPTCLLYLGLHPVQTQVQTNPGFSSFSFWQ